MSRKRKLNFTWNEFQKRYKSCDSSGGWFKRCTVDYNRLRNDPCSLTIFFNSLEKQLQERKKKSRTKAFSTFFGVKSSENKDSSCEKDREPLKKQTKGVFSSKKVSSNKLMPPLKDSKH